MQEVWENYKKASKNINTTKKKLQTSSKTWLKTTKHHKHNYKKTKLLCVVFCKLLVVVVEFLAHVLYFTVFVWHTETFFNRFQLICFTFSASAKAPPHVWTSFLRFQYAFNTFSTAVARACQNWISPVQGRFCFQNVFLSFSANVFYSFWTFLACQNAKSKKR